MKTLYIGPQTIVFADSAWPKDDVFRLGLKFDPAQPISHEMTLELDAHQVWGIMREALQFLRPEDD